MTGCETENKRTQASNGLGFLLLWTKSCYGYISMYNKTYVIDEHTTVTKNFQSYGESLQQDWGGSLYLLLHGGSFLWIGFALFFVGVLALLALPFMAVWRIWNPVCVGYSEVRK